MAVGNGEEEDSGHSEAVGVTTGAIGAKTRATDITAVSQVIRRVIRTTTAPKVERSRKSIGRNTSNECESSALSDTLWPTTRGWGSATSDHTSDTGRRPSAPEAQSPRLARRRRPTPIGRRLCALYAIIGSNHWSTQKCSNADTFTTDCVSKNCSICPSIETPNRRTCFAANVRTKSTRIWSISSRLGSVANPQVLSSRDNTWWLWI